VRFVDGGRVLALKRHTLIRPVDELSSRLFNSNGHFAGRTATGRTPSAVSEMQPILPIFLFHLHERGGKQIDHLTKYVFLSS
jgi:hypothetical protein